MVPDGNQKWRLKPTRRPIMPVAGGLPLAPIAGGLPVAPVAGRALGNGLENSFISNKHCESHFSSAKTTQKKSCFLRAITAVPIR